MTPSDVTRMNGNPLTVAGAATALGEKITRTMFPINPFALGLQEPSVSDIRAKRLGVNCDRVAAQHKVRTGKDPPARKFSPCRTPWAAARLST